MYLPTLFWDQSYYLQNAWLWLADALPSANHDQAFYEKLFVKSFLMLVTLTPVKALYPAIGGYSYNDMIIPAPMITLKVVGKLTCVKPQKKT